MSGMDVDGKGFGFVTICWKSLESGTRLIPTQGGVSHPYNTPPAHQIPTVHSRAILNRVSMLSAPMDGPNSDKDQSLQRLTSYRYGSGCARRHILSERNSLRF